MIIKDEVLVEYISVLVVVVALKDALREAMEWDWEGDDVPEQVVNLCRDALIKSGDMIRKIREEK